MPRSRIPSPSRSQSGITPRRAKRRGTRSVGSPARSTASGRLTSVIDQFRDYNMDSFLLSPMGSRRSVLSDNTDIVEPRRKSWWKNLNESSRDVLEVLSQDKVADNMMIDELIDIDISQEKKNYTLDLPESSDNESIHSIVLPQRKLLILKENQHQNKFGQLIGSRETAKLHKTSSTYHDKTVNAGTRELFQGAKRSKPVFPAALLTISNDKTVTDKTKENINVEPKLPVRNLFGKRPANKPKNIFAEFIVSESEDEISEIHPKQVFGFQKEIEKCRVSTVYKGRDNSPTSSITTDIETDFLKYLPSSTMVDHQLEDLVTGTPVKRAKLSNLSEGKESEPGTNTNMTVNKTKQSNKSITSLNANDISLNNSRVTRSQLKNNTPKSSSGRNKLRNSKIVMQEIDISGAKPKGTDKLNNTTLNKSQKASKNKMDSISKVNEIDINDDNVEINTGNNQTKASNKSTRSPEVHNKTVAVNNVEENQHEYDEDNFTLTYENDDNEVIDIAQHKLDKDTTQSKKSNLTSKDSTIIEKSLSDNSSDRLKVGNKSHSRSRVKQSLEKSLLSLTSNVKQTGGDEVNQRQIESLKDVSKQMEQFNENNIRNENHKARDVEKRQEIVKDKTDNGQYMKDETNKIKEVCEEDAKEVHDEINDSQDDVHHEAYARQEVADEEFNENNELENYEGNKSLVLEDKNESDKGQEVLEINKILEVEEVDTKEEAIDEKRADLSHDIANKGDERQVVQNQDEANKSEDNADDREINEVDIEKDESEQSQEVSVKPDNESGDKNNESQVECKKSEVEINKSNVESNKSEVEHNESEIEHSKSEDKDSESELDYNESEVENNESKVENNDSEDEHNESEVENDESEVENNESEVENVESEVEHNESKVEHNDSEVGCNVREIEHNESEVEHNESEIEHSKSESEDKDSESELDYNESEVENNESEVEHDESKVEHNESEVEYNESEVEHNESEVEHNESKVEHNESEIEHSEAEDKGSESELEYNESELEDNKSVVDDENAEMSDSDNQADEMDIDQDQIVVEESDAVQDSEQNHGAETEDVSGSTTPNVTHDTTGRNRNKHILNKSPEAILHDKTKQMDSFIIKGRNTSIRKSKSIINNLNIKPSLAPPRDSIGFSDGTRDSSAEGSGWDSHRTTRKTLRRTFGKDYTLRKSLRTLVMEKSAKRQTEYLEQHETAKFPQANSTEHEEMDVVDRVEESTHEMSPRTRQSMYDRFLEKVKKDNLERRLKIENDVRCSLKHVHRDPMNLFKVPSKPPPRRLKPAVAKPKKSNPIIPLDELPSDLIEDMKYKPPKRFRPSNASWITKRLYKFIETKLEPTYDYKARVRAEKLVETIYEYVKSIKRYDVAPPDATEVLKHELARLEVVKTHYDFYEFIREYMPREIRIMIIPDVVNKIPLPRQGVFADIIHGNSAHR